MFSFEVLEVDDPRWSQFVKTSFIHDFHHTAYYHKLDNGDISRLFVAHSEGGFIAFPLVIRPIVGTVYFDATSVYGYGGPIFNNSETVYSLELRGFFWTSFNKYCFENNIISVFSRMHPLINQLELFNGFGEIVELNKTIAIDLRLSPEEQRKQYRKSNKSEINQLRKKEFSVSSTNSEDDIDRFIEIYYETMDRVNAAPHYYFSKEYFYDFLNNTHFDSQLLVAKFNNNIVAGAIFTNSSKIMQYHLAGTTEEFMRLTPMKLILDEARLIGNALGFEFLHLGGGVGGSTDDSLFRFKAGFSDLQCQFTIWKYIVNNKIYNDLVEQSGHVNSTYFPLYRLA